MASHTPPSGCAAVIARPAIPPIGVSSGALCFTAVARPCAYSCSGHCGQAPALDQVSTHCRPQGRAQLQHVRGALQQSWRFWRLGADARGAGAAAGCGAHGRLHPARAHAGDGDALGEQPAAVRLCLILASLILAAPPPLSLTLAANLVWLRSPPSLFLRQPTGLVCGTCKTWVFL